MTPTTCGTVAAHAKHRRRGEEPCEPCRDAMRAYHTARDYGITPERYAAMLEDQDGRCAICRQTETITRSGRPLSLSVDHDHQCCPGRKSCGQCVRRLLCRRCNQAIGLADDNAELLRAAAAYLRKYT